MGQRGCRHASPAGQRDRIENGVGTRDQVAARHPRPQHVVVHAAFRLHGEPDVLFDAEVWKQIGELECAAEAGSVSDPKALERMLGELDQLHGDIRDRVGEMPKHASIVARYASAEQTSEALLHEPEARL